MNYLVYWLIAIALILAAGVITALVLRAEYRRFLADDKNKNKDKQAERARAKKKKYKAVFLGIFIPLLVLPVLGLCVNATLYAVENSRIIDAGYEQSVSDIAEYKTRLEAYIKENGLLLLEQSDYAADDEDGYVRIYKVDAVGCDVIIELGYDKNKCEQYYVVIAQGSYKTAAEFSSSIPYELVDGLTELLSGLKGNENKTAEAFMDKYASDAENYPYEKYKRMDICGHWVQGVTGSVKVTSGKRSFMYMETGLTGNAVKQ